MESSRVWKDLLTGRQAVSTIPCPSCGALVPEFRIHSHLDTCLTILPPEEPAPAAVRDVAHELSDGEQNRHRRGRASRGQGKGRGQSRKRREGAEIKKGRDGVTYDRKRAKGNVECDKERDAPVLSEDDDDELSFYQRWEYSVLGFNELAKSRKERLLSDLQKQELFASGVLTIERQEVSAMVLELDRLLDETTEGTAADSSLSLPRFRNGIGFETPMSNQIGAAERRSRSSRRMNTSDAERHDDTESEKDNTLEAWWEQWEQVEWPEGPVPSGFLPNLPRKSRAAEVVQMDRQKVEMERSAAQ